MSVKYAYDQLVLDEIYPENGVYKVKTMSGIQLYKKIGESYTCETYNDDGQLIVRETECDGIVNYIRADGYSNGYHADIGMPRIASIDDGEDKDFDILQFMRP